MADPISTGFFTAATGTVLKLIEFDNALSNVNSQTRVFLELLKRVHRDTEWCINARTRMAEILDTYHPEQKERIDGCIRDITEALKETGQCIEGTIHIRGSEKVRGSSLEQRFKWVLGNHDKFVNRQLRLQTCHTSLTTAINALSSLEASWSAKSFVTTSQPPPLITATLTTAVQVTEDDRTYYASLKRLRRGRNSSSVDQTIPQPYQSVQSAAVASPATSVLPTSHYSTGTSNAHCPLPAYSVYTQVELPVSTPTRRSPNEMSDDHVVDAGSATNSFDPYRPYVPRAPSHASYHRQQPEAIGETWTAGADRLNGSALSSSQQWSQETMSAFDCLLDKIDDQISTNGSLRLLDDDQADKELRPYRDAPRAIEQERDLRQE